jgi:hypothetical protein
MKKSTAEILELKIKWEIQKRDEYQNEWNRNLGVEKLSKSNKFILTS